MEGTRVSRRGLGLGCGRLWQLAIFAATGTLGVTSQTEAAVFYWQDSPPAAAEPAPEPKQPVRRAKPQRHGEKKSAVVEKESKPQGPLLISISIAQQKLRVYDANGLYAESPVSTGMPGHSTPMGVFSVIQKQKFHQSNIYSGAPMPFMQRITWSGIALHAGVVPGHPAAHGCIRLPAAFAGKMYGWTRMGARVIITPGGVTPANFSHPLLASVRVLPQPVAAQETKADAAAIQAPEKLEAKAAEISADVGLELRPTVGHAVEMKAAGEASSKVQTADASGALPAALSAASDAAPASGHVSPPTNAAVSDKVDSVKRDASGMVAETEAAKLNDPATMKPDEAASAEVKPKAADSETKPADVVNTQPANAETPAGEAAKPGDDATKTTPPADAVKAATAPPSAPTTTNEAPLKADLKSDFAKADLYTPLKKTEQVAVFVSRKDSKLF